MSDAEMMRFMAGCMLAEGRAPSVETPLHSLLPHRVIAHTHDVATMSLTNVGDGTAERLVSELFEGAIVYVPYIRPGFPLARAVSEHGGPDPARRDRDSRWPTTAWSSGVTTREQCARAADAGRRTDRRVSASRPGAAAGSARAVEPDPRPKSVAVERSCVLPVVRGALSLPERVILHFDDGDDVLAALDRERHARADSTRAWRRRSTCSAPAGCRSGSTSTCAAPDETLVAQCGACSPRRARSTRRTTAATPRRGERPLDDWAKVVLVARARHDHGVQRQAQRRDRESLLPRRRSRRSRTPRRWTGSSFCPSADVFEFEHWPLERRKVEEQIAARARRPGCCPGTSWW